MADRHEDAPLGPLRAEPLRQSKAEVAMALGVLCVMHAPSHGVMSTGIKRACPSPYTIQNR
jgi:hypothetical protein